MPIPNQMYQPYNQQVIGYGQNYNGYVPYPYQQQQRLDPVQQYQQPAQQMFSQQAFQQPQPALNGRIVAAVENITANDVPMDGSVAIFPKQDMSEIYAKSWNADGTIRTVVYKPYTATQPEVTNSMTDMSKLKIGLSDESTAAFMQRFDELDKKIDDLMPKSTPKKVGLKREAENE